jgi:hypothetical protein
MEPALAWNLPRLSYVGNYAMRKKASHFLLSALIVLSGTFSMVPMAFCTMKAVGKHGGRTIGLPSCCNSPVSKTKHGCPICPYVRVAPTQANIPAKAQQYKPYVVTLLPGVFARPVQLSDLAVTDYPVIIAADTSPPLYLQFGSLRI